MCICMCIYAWMYYIGVIRVEGLVVVRKDV